MGAKFILQLHALELNAVTGHCSMVLQLCHMPYVPIYPIQESDEFKNIMDGLVFTFMNYFFTVSEVVVNLNTGTLLTNQDFKKNLAP